MRKIWWPGSLLFCNISKIHWQHIIPEYFLSRPLIVDKNLLWVIRNEPLNFRFKRSSSRIESGLSKELPKLYQDRQASDIKSEVDESLRLYSFYLNPSQLCTQTPWSSTILSALLATWSKEAYHWYLLASLVKTNKSSLYMRRQVSENRLKWQPLDL